MSRSRPIRERLRRARRAYTRGGLDELRASARAELTRTATTAPDPLAPSSVPPEQRGLAYQEKLAGSLEERWELISAALSTNVRSVLDVGCNLGDIAARCAQHGLWTVGIDRDEELVRTARTRHLDVPNLAFAHSAVEPGTVEDLPAFDAVLLLSVQHHWLQLHGPQIAGTMLRRLVQRTRRVVIFESASRRARYGRYPPDFTDNHEPSVTAYLEAYLEEHVGNVVREIRPLGKTRCVGEREPYRWSWALYR